MIKRAWPIIVTALLAIAIPVGLAHLEQAVEPAVMPRIDSVPAEVRTEESAYDRELGALNAQLRAAEQANERYPGQWMRIETVVSLYVSRAQLTGDHDDYLRAERLLGEAFELAPEGSGPLLTRAYLNYTLHRLPRVEPDLARIEQGILVPRGVLLQIRALRADVAFHSGRFEEAERMHREIDELEQSSSSAFAVAHDLWKTGRFEEAERWLARAASRSERHPRSHAWMELQRGLLDLDRGRYDEALGHYRAADRLFTGHWLIEEHIAEIHAIRGEHAEAERRYRALIARTGDPEFMDALAGVLEERGNAREAERQRARATAAYEHMLETLPEAAYGHALGHFLEHGAPERALSLARENFALRPGGEASVLLAQALLMNGDVPGARERIDAILATPFRTADLHATAAKIYRAAGDEGRASEEEERARAIHPQANEELDWLTARRREPER